MVIGELEKWGFKISGESNIKSTNGLLFTETSDLTQGNRSQGLIFLSKSVESQMLSQVVTEEFPLQWEGKKAKPGKKFADIMGQKSPQHLLLGIPTSHRELGFPPSTCR